MELRSHFIWQCGHLVYGSQRHDRLLRMSKPIWNSDLPAWKQIILPRNDRHPGCSRGKNDSWKYKHVLLSNGWRPPQTPFLFFSCHCFFFFFNACEKRRVVVTSVIYRIWCQFISDLKALSIWSSSETWLLSYIQEKQPIRPHLS